MTQEEIELIRDRVLYALKGFVSIGKLDNQTMINILDSILKPYTKLDFSSEGNSNTVEEKFLIRELSYYCKNLND